jgi:heat-inducible transcriptional repressor
MSDLTEMGYIAQPHVSAGRIPTDRGYRFYVDSLMSACPLSIEEEIEIEINLRTAGLETKELLKHSSALLAEFSGKAGVFASTSPGQDQTFKTVEFMKLAKDRILVILVSGTGAVQSKVIRDEDDLHQETLERYSRMLNDMLKDLDLEQARARIERELATEKADFDAILSKTLRLCHIILSVTASRELFIEGQTNILEEPEFAHVERLKAILIAFEEKSRLLKILDRTLEARGIQILIGSEHGLGEMESCSIVAYPIRAEGKNVGSIGVIGPKRMNYHKVIPLVDTTARILTKLMKKFVENAV